MRKYVYRRAFALINVWKSFDYETTKLYACRPPCHVCHGFDKGVPVLQHGLLWSWQRCRLERKLVNPIIHRDFARKNGLSTVITKHTLSLTEATRARSSSPTTEANAQNELPSLSMPVVMHLADEIQIPEIKVIYNASNTGLSS